MTDELRLGIAAHLQHFRSPIRRFQQSADVHTEGISRVRTRHASHASQRMHRKAAKRQLHRHGRAERVDLDPIDVGVLIERGSQIAGEITCEACARHGRARRHVHPRTLGPVVHSRRHRRIVSQVQHQLFARRHTHHDAAGA